MDIWGAPSALRVTRWARCGPSITLRAFSERLPITTPPAVAAGPTGLDASLQRPILANARGLTGDGPCVGGVHYLLRSGVSARGAVVATATAMALLLLLGRATPTLAATPSIGGGSDGELAKMLSDVGFSGDRLVTAL